jgi:hypothetical protein
MEVTSGSNAMTAGRRSSALSFDHASVALLVCTACAMLATLGDYGFTYDEPPHIRYGERILRFYASGFTERGSINTSYVGGFDLLAALVRRISPLNALETNHLICVFVAQCGLIGTWKLGSFLGGARAGFFSVLFLLSIPVYYGHQFNNPKDVPFAAGYVWGLYYVAQWIALYGPVAAPPGNFRAPPWSFIIRCGLVLGLGMSVRIGGALLIAYLALFICVALVECKRLNIVHGWTAIRPIALPLAVAVGVSWLLMVLLWPKAMLSPFKGPAKAAEVVTHFQSFDSPTLFEGRMLSSHKVPWYYLPTYFIRQLPEFAIICLLGTLGWLGVRSYRAITRRQQLPLTLLLLVVAAFLPPTYAALRHSVLYDGLRHFLFLMPPIAILCGVGFSAVLRRYKSGPIAHALVACLALFVIDQTYALVRLHPHQHVFFNRTSGGTKQAAKRFETEYYGSVYRELTTDLQAHLWTKDKDRYLNTTHTVTGCGSKLFFTENLPLNFQYTSMRDIKHADIFATYARDRCLERLKDRPELLRVERDGATLAIARSLTNDVVRTKQRPTK